MYNKAIDVKEELIMSNELRNGNGHELANQELSVAQAEPVHESSGEIQRNERTVSPRASVYDSGEEVLLELEMPGVDRHRLDIRVDNDELTIYGARLAHADDSYEVLHQERHPLSYRRTFILSDRVDSANIKAGYEHGVLRLTLPKVAKAKPRKITID